MLFVAGLAAGCSQETEAAVSATPVAVQVQRLAQEQLEERRSLSGDVQPWEVLPLSFKVGGRISRILVDEGDQVKKGAPIAFLDGRDYVLTRNLARAQLEALEPHLHRAESLYAADALPKAQLDEVEGKMNVARIQRDQAQTQLAYAGLQAPIDGVVIRRMASPGQMAGPTTPVVVIASLDPVKVSLPVAQRDLPLFQVGDRIELTSVGLKTPFQGTVHSIAYTADEKTRTFPVVVEVPNPDLQLRAGMIVEAKLTLAQHQGFFVPLQAVRRDLEGQPAVLVVRRAEAGSRAKLQRIRVGAVFGDRIHVTEGLKAGDELIIRGLAADGDPVTTSEPESAENSEP